MSLCNNWTEKPEQIDVSLQRPVKVKHGHDRAVRPLSKTRFQNLKRNTKKNLLSVRSKSQEIRRILTLGVRNNYEKIKHWS